MPRRDPNQILGVSVGATPAEIKAAWRRLARANHPDLTGDDPAASRLATRRMAEINDAYATLTRSPERGRASDWDAPADDAEGAESEPARRRGGPPAPKPTRPVTARVDTSHSFRPRNQTVDGGPRRSPLRGQAPPAPGHVDREPPRASAPTGPLERRRPSRARRRPVPALPDAEARVITFGKFHDHTLGEIARFEPSYIDWVAGTVNHDPDLVDAARVIQADLDRRGDVRRARVPVDRRRSA